MPKAIEYAQPLKLPVEVNIADFYQELEDASYNLGMLQVAHSKISNSEHLIKPLITREATLSSKIEGTITDNKDVFILDATGKTTKTDTNVVANYRQAMRLAIDNSGKRITNHKIRELHQVLLKDTPHQGQLGKYRTVDAWIGAGETTPIEKAKYVAAHYTQIMPYMDELLKYANDHNESALIKAAVFHYQFEAIHPFEDGNGRIGRMLVPALLHYLGKLSSPVLYTSEYFEKNADEYKRLLHEVDQTKDVVPWIKFFLKSVVVQSQKSIEIVDKILLLNKAIHQQYGNSNSPNLARVIDYMFSQPVFSVPSLMRNIGISRGTANNLVATLVAGKTIEELDLKGNYNTRYYYFPLLLNVIA